MLAARLMARILLFNITNNHQNVFPLDAIGASKKYLL